MEEKIMFEDDDFFINDDELAEDNQLSIVDSAELGVVETIAAVIEDMKSNIKFNERTDLSKNIRMLASYIDNLINLDNLQTTSNVSDEEMFELVDEILKKTTVLTLGNIDDVLKNEEESEEMPEIEDKDEGDGTDW